MQTEFLIIGQGICGSFLSYFLEKEGRDFLVIDNMQSNSPSRVAAGIINPVTGRRMVTVWMAEDVLPFAWNSYTAMGHELGITAIQQKNILDFFPNPFMRENFIKRTNEKNEYVHAYPEQNHFNTWFNYEFGCGEIRPSYVANLDLLLPAWRTHLKRNERLLEEDFSTNDLTINNNTIHYKNITAQRIIFCEGTGAVNNPYFKNLPFALNKGEALVVEIPGLPNQHIYKKSMLLAPLQEKDMFWIGSNYIWDFEDADPTEEFRRSTEMILKEWVKAPFKIIDHRAGIRPATVERRPFAGTHPLHPAIGILNGMGTKGCSLAPFLAKQLTDHLCYNSLIASEADISRFAKILSR